MFFFGIIMSVFALIGIFSPETTWKMTEGWKFKDAEPSDGYLAWTRFSSVIALIVVWIIVFSS